MTDHSAFQLLLASVADEVSRVDTGWRVIPGTEGVPLPTRIARAIDETVLPCRLTFQANDGPALTCEVGNRRLHRLIGPVGDALAPHDTLFERDLFDTDAGPVAAALRELGDANADVLVKSVPLSAASGAAGSGLSADALMAATGNSATPGEPVDQTPQVAEFLAWLTDMEGPWVLIEAGQVMAHSDGSDVAALQSIAADLSAAATLGQGTMSASLMAVGTCGGKHSRLVAAWQGDWVFAKSDAAACPEQVTKRWRELGL